MNNKNPKSNNSIVQEAEMIIENYIERREMSELESYKNLKQKYERLKILSIAIFLTSTAGIVLTIIM